MFPDSTTDPTRVLQITPADCQLIDATVESVLASLSTDTLQDMPTDCQVLLRQKLVDALNDEIDELEEEAEDDPEA